MGNHMNHPPPLWWNPSWIQSTKAMKEEGAVAGSPFADFSAALDAADRRRSEHDAASPGDNVFLITYTGEGWAAFEYSESRLGKADLDEFEPRGLPLGGSADDPRTYIVDARGRVGKLTAGATPAQFSIEKVDRASLPDPAAPATYLPAVVPKSVVNHAKNVEWHPRIALRPSGDIEELSESLRWIHENLPADVKVKAGGWRHSWSPVAATDGVYIHPEHMRGVELLSSLGPSQSLLRGDPDASHLFQVLAGTRIRQINSALWAEVHALPCLGGYDGQTLGGVLTTGTHGSVLQFGPLAEMVRSLDLVRFDGTKVRIEPASRAITAQDAFRAKRPDWELVQNDDDFNAVLVSMGTMGVVHSFIVEAVPRFWLKEVRTVTTMAEAQAILRGGNIYHLMDVDPTPGWIDAPNDRAFEGHPKPAYHEELLWNPYTDKLVVTSRHPVGEEKRRELEHNEPPWFANAPVRNLFRALKLDVMADEYSRPDLTELGTELLSGVLDEVVEFIARVRPQLLKRFIDNALDQMVDPSYIQRSYKVFNVGEGANNIPAQSGTVSIPLRDDLWLRAIDIIRATAQKLAAEERKYQTGPISLRFVRGSSILLADAEDACKFEIIFGGDNDHIQALSREIVKEYYDALYEVFGGDVRLHWGQLIPDGTLEAPGRGGHRVRESYRLYDRWRHIRDRYDPSGRGLNAWQERVLP